MKNSLGMKNKLKMIKIKVKVMCENSMNHNICLLTNQNSQCSMHQDLVCINHVLDNLKK